jgi:hypothetical protein
MPTFEMPEVGEIGLPPGIKSTGQTVDFKEDQFTIAIESKGYLLLWERALACPCAPVTTQTEQPDPNCSLCHGQGWLYFGSHKAQDLSEYTFDELQKELIARSGGMVVRGIMHSLSSKQDNVDVLSNWVEGMAMLTVRNSTKLGYYDRITSLDGTITYTETITADGSDELATRYPVVDINLLRSVDTIYQIGTHFNITKGVITWFSGSAPAADTRLAAHYLCHPVWLVVEHPHAARVTLKKYKSAATTSPMGSAVQLPVQAMIRYEFLPEPGND